MNLGYPLSAAWWSAVHLESSVAWTSAPFRSKYRTHERFPENEALCNGVAPSLSLQVNVAPALIKTFKVLNDPLKAAFLAKSMKSTGEISRRNLGRGSDPTN